jgi:hypothetical protein
MKSKLFERHAPGQPPGVPADHLPPGGGVAVGDVTGTTFTNTARPVAPFGVELAAAHAPIDGNHSHPHPSYGSQGGDTTHDHQHSHSGDANHGHGHGAAVLAAGMLTGGTVEHAQPLGIDQFIASAETGGTWEPVAETMARLGARFGVEQDGADWRLIDAKNWTEAGLTAAAAVPTAEWAGTPDVTGGYVSVMDALAEQLAQGDRPVLAGGWRSEMAYEGKPTGDGRYINPGAIEYRNPPQPLMLQTVTEGGHYGAVLAGAITGVGTVSQVAMGKGFYDDSDAGRQAEQIVAARGKFGVSIDVCESEGEFECTERDMDGDCIDGIVKFSLIRVMGLTMTPFPAFEDAFIEADTAPTAGQVAASATVDEPCVECAEQAATTAELHPEPEPVLAAAQPPSPPPARYFENPGFHVGDRRMVRQPNGRYACPLTIEAPDENGWRRVYGHIASWFSCHTGYTDRCMTPPRSQTGYAAFNMRPFLTAEGGIVHVGHLSMGCGHASTTRAMSVEAVRAHYDGGPGVERMAQVVAGDDDFGPWIAGVVKFDATEAQVQAFAACSTSGDWRSVWSGKGLDLVAILAGVTVPGFPIAGIAASAAASGLVAPIGDPHAAFANGTVTALVASGVIRQPMPWERAQAEQAQQIADLTARVATAEATIAPLRPVAAERLVASMQG